MATTSGCINWLFGRGLSIACNLPWSVPGEWQQLPRDEKIERIKSTLREEMDLTSVDVSVITRLLRLLGNHMEPKWRNRFITTNWDWLLQREILALDFDVQPDWLAESHVFHLNGTVEELDFKPYRSPFLLEEDPANQRTSAPEANIAFTHMSWDRTFVVVGMSFECETDKFLLTALNHVEDDLPIGESTWIVVNPDSTVLASSCSSIASALPRASVQCVCDDFTGWIDSDLPELQECGAISL